MAESFPQSLEPAVFYPLSPGSFVPRARRVATSGSASSASQSERGVQSEGNAFDRLELEQRRRVAAQEEAEAATRQTVLVEVQRLARTGKSLVAWTVDAEEPEYVPVPVSKVPFDDMGLLTENPAALNGVRLQVDSVMRNGRRFIKSAARVDVAADSGGASSVHGSTLEQPQEAASSKDATAAALTGAVFDALAKSASHAGSVSTKGLGRLFSACAEVVPEVRGRFEGGVDSVLDKLNARRMTCDVLRGFLFDHPDLLTLNFDQAAGVLRHLQSK